MRRVLGLCSLAQHLYSQDHHDPGNDLKVPWTLPRLGEPKMYRFESHQLPFENWSKNLNQPFSKRGRPRLPSGD